MSNQGCSEADCPHLRYHADKATRLQSEVGWLQVELDEYKNADASKTTCGNCKLYQKGCAMNCPVVYDCHRRIAGRDEELLYRNNENARLEAENARLKTALDEITSVKETFENCVKSDAAKRIDRLRKIVVDQVEEIDRLKAYIEELQRTHDIDRRRWTLGREEEAEEDSWTEFDE